MKLVIIGATSFPGQAVMKELCRKVDVSSVTCVVRSTSDISTLSKMGVRLHEGDVTEPTSILPVLNDSTAYLEMTHPKYYHLSLETLRTAGVQRAYFVTSTGVFSQHNHNSNIYKTNESKIRNSGLTYTILRSSMIYGSHRDRNMHKLIKILNSSPIFPVFGGDSLMQPVYVDDLASGIVSAISCEETKNQEYTFAGPEPISYKYALDVILKELNKKRLKFNISVELVARAARYAERIPKFPIKEEQLRRVAENKSHDISKPMNELNFRPRSFEVGIAAEIAEMRAAGVIGA